LNLTKEQLKYDKEGHWQSQRGDNALQVTLAAVAMGHDTATPLEPKKGTFYSVESIRIRIRIQQFSSIRIRIRIHNSTLRDKMNIKSLRY
jgi:hypothetical protein